MARSRGPVALALAVCVFCVVLFVHWLRSRGGSRASRASEASLGFSALEALEVVEATLVDDWGHEQYNRIEVHPALRDARLVNRNGTFAYELDPADDDRVMAKLFPKYVGPTIPLVRVDACVMLSVDIEKYAAARAATLANLRRYVLPPLRVHLGYTPQTMHRAPNYASMRDPVRYRGELTLGMLDIFAEFAELASKSSKSSKSSQSSHSGHSGQWLLYLEDDVRPVNVRENADLSVLRNIPVDAELIRPIVGRDEPVDLGSVTYAHSYGGGLNHSFYISASGCRKVLEYAKKYGWRYAADVDLYKLARGCGCFPTGLDGWSLVASGNKNEISPLLAEEDKIAMYHTSHILFDQTSLPISRAFK
jgi:hypothetical protein